MTFHESSKALTWGILGTGAIANIFARGLRESRTGRLVAVGSRSQSAADMFGEIYNIARRYGSYEKLLADERVQAVYIAMPHPLHAQWAIKAAEAGKHMLCEKPLALNHAEAMAIVEAARRNDVFLMEAFMYRCHPQTAKLVELVRSGVIGKIHVVQATFSFHTPFRPKSRLLNNALGGGGILDVGCYCTSMTRLIAGAALGQDFAEPIKVAGTARIGEVSRVDEYAIASLSFPENILAHLFSGVQVMGNNVVHIFGSEGSILVPRPWVPEGRHSTLVINKNESMQEITVENDTPLYALEADTVAKYIEAREAPAMRWGDTLGNMKTLDRWRSSVGMVYDAELPEDQVLPVHKRPLTVHSDSLMKYGSVAGVEKPISRLVMGVDNQTSWPHASVMLDDFFERGGNCFDTAYGYAQGMCEKMLGHWVKNRRVRKQVVILDKGAHTPFCTPEALTRQLYESLERLQMDYVDIYMLHRDNPEVPVDEFIMVLNEHKNAGRIRAFGASNWSIERIEAANNWAMTNKLTGFAVVSNNFSLAHMLKPVWPGCLSASDERSRAWFTKTQMPLMPWSSQARGFFTRSANPHDDARKNPMPSWDSDDNFQRLERANILAKARNVLPINIALAYVLCQPFPTFPLIGPRTLAETRTSFPALTIELTPQELRWLNLEQESL